MLNLKDYQKIVGSQAISQIKNKAKLLKGKHIVAISSTNQGGGVAEMMNSLVFLFNDCGIDFGWRVVHGQADFFNVTKEFHNALQGDKIQLTKNKKKIYSTSLENFSVFTHLKKHDLVIVHDPQPLALIAYYKKIQPWVLRLHVDLSRPDRQLWRYLRQFVKRYDRVVVSTQEYQQKVPIDSRVISPAIDPLSLKNIALSNLQMSRLLKRQGINLTKPIIAQISRFDKWKDPEGVIKVFKLVKKQLDCQLVLLGNLATDDPQGVQIYHNIIEKYGHMKDVKILMNLDKNDQTVNALQSQAQVIIQKSYREGFGLTVSEALYKGTPVVASKVGGIPQQVIDGVNGFLHDPRDYGGFSQSVVKLLKSSRLRRILGEAGRQHIQKNFLITRLVSDWLDLFNELL